MWYSTFYNGKLDHKYISLGIQYFILARFGANFPFNPSSGNLYHLSFELLIKSYLIKNGYTGKDLKTMFNHNLVKLWLVLKTKVNNSELNKYDLVIKNLDHWDRVRYIDLENSTNAQSIVIISGSAPKDYYEKIKKVDFHSQKYFTLYTDDMDELFSAFFKSLNIPSEELLKVPDFVWGRKIYDQNNKHNIYKVKL